MIHFMKFRWLYFLISGIVIIPGLVSLLFFGLKPSIDFTGGTELQLSVYPHQGVELTQDTVKNAIGESLEVTEVLVSSTDVLVRAKPAEVEQKDEALASLRASVGDVTEHRFETIGPVLGKELVEKTIVALLLSATGITFYVAYRFQDLKYGVSAVLAMLHDTLVILGVFSILGKAIGIEVDVLFVTALLTILSFSVHDTIVVYDRIRELRKKQPLTPYLDTIDLAVTETMSRSINNSMTIIFMLVVLWLLGGETIRWFVFALLLGTVTGTYSSTFTAAPLLTVWDALARRRKK